jgi:hypothetical protein
MSSAKIIEKRWQQDSWQLADDGESKEFSLQSGCEKKTS